MSNAINHVDQELTDAELEDAVGGAGTALAGGVFDPAKLKPEVQLQVAMQRENRLLAAASNILKTRQEAAGHPSDDDR
jgi:hypothetical protein